jgi:hypothetical protein
MAGRCAIAAGAGVTKAHARSPAQISRSHRCECAAGRLGLRVAHDLEDALVFIWKCAQDYRASYLHGTSACASMTIGSPFVLVSIKVLLELRIVLAEQLPNRRAQSSFGLSSKEEALMRRRPDACAAQLPLLQRDAKGRPLLVASRWIPTSVPVLRSAWCLQCSASSSLGRAVGVKASCCRAQQGHAPNRFKDAEL